MPAFTPAPLPWRCLLSATTVALGAPGCERQPTEIMDEGAMRLVVTPAQAQVMAGDSLDFSAVAYDRQEQATEVNVSWRIAGGGSIQGSGQSDKVHWGRYKSARCGTDGIVTDTVIAVARPGNATDTALVSIDCPDSATVATVTVTPASATVNVGATVQLAATLKDASGSTLSGKAIAWSSSNPAAATVSAGGLVTGVAAGSATITAGSEGKSGNAAVTVVSVATTTILPGQSIQAAVDAHPPGTQFLLKAGVHRLQSVAPKDGNAFIGEAGTVLSGARLLTQFIREGAYWVATGQTQAGQLNGGCDTQVTNACQYPEDLFFDDVPLAQVTTLAAVGPGKWFFDYAADRIYFQDDPAGRKVEISDKRHAFQPTADNVTIRNLIIEKYANPAQYGAIQTTASGGSRLAWTVEASELRFNHGAGVAAGNGARILRNKIHHNGQLGINAAGDNILVEGNEISFNNTMGFSTEWEAGGAKFTVTRGLVVRGNNAHHNTGPGLWTDIDNINTLYEDNVVSDNSVAGIFHEVSYAAVIRNNKVERNGFGKAVWLWGAGILIAASPDVEVYGNTVVDNFNAISAVQQGRGDGRYGPHIIQNLWVHDNYVKMTKGRTGLVKDWGDDSIFTSRNNRFDRNTYCLGTDTYYFQWANAPRTSVEWVQQYHLDVSGAFRC